MIDQRTYNRLHPNSTTFVFSKDPVLLYDEYPSEIELNADVLDELDYILCPHVVQGFYLKEKHWGIHHQSVENTMLTSTSQLIRQQGRGGKVE
jgi:hypothetical protein